MDTVFLVYKTDNLHSYMSRDVIGVAIDRFTAYQIIHQHARKEHIEITTEQLFNLDRLNQTQGCEGSGEYMIEDVPTNTLL